MNDKIQLLLAQALALVSVIAEIYRDKDERTSTLAVMAEEKIEAARELIN